MAATHWLEYNLHMDEADQTGVAFEPSECGQFVEVFHTYAPHYMGVLPSHSRTLKVADARKLWSEMLKEDDGFGSPVYTRPVRRV